MGVKKYPLTPEEFKEIYAKVPRLCVDVIVVGEQGVLMTKRAIEPCIGHWHIPGGVIHYKESLDKAIRRIAQKELSLQVNDYEIVGIVEYQNLNASESYGDPRALECVVREFDGEVKIDDEASDFAWFTETNENMLIDQKDFLVEHGLLKSAKTL